MKINIYDLEYIELSMLLRALLSGLKFDGVRMIIRSYINSKIEEYKKAGAAFTVHYNKNKVRIRVICVNHGRLDHQDLGRLEVLEKLYNTVDEWGWNDESQSDL